LVILSEPKDLFLQRGNAPSCTALSTFNLQLLFGVSSATTVSPPRFRASSMENSARLIKSVTMSFAVVVVLGHGLDNSRAQRYLRRVPRRP